MIWKWSVFGGYSLSSHAQTTISISSAISFQPNFAGLLKLPQEIILFCIFSNEPSKNSVILYRSWIFMGCLWKLWSLCERVFIFFENWLAFLLWWCILLESSRDIAQPGLARLSGGQKVASSNLAIPTIFLFSAIQSFMAGFFYVLILPNEWQAFIA